MHPHSFLRPFFLSLLVLAAPAAARAQTGPTAVVTPLYVFSGSDGDTPYGPLVYGNDGFLYGVTYQGGQYGDGVIFQLAPDGSTFAKVYEFGTATNDASHPIVGLTDGNDGFFYGTSDTGGSVNIGAAFKVSNTGAYQTIHSFGLDDSPVPNSVLVRGNDEHFYGTTAGGGHTYASVYRIAADGTDFSLLGSFFDGTSAQTPIGLALGDDGSFYGATEAGGADGDGVIFKATYNTTTNTGTLTYPLASLSTVTGGRPADALINGGDGYFYGPAYYYGSGDGGTVFKVTADGSEVTALCSFSDSAGGFNPNTRLLRASDGNFYGMTLNGGVGGSGAVFQVTPAGVLTTLVLLTPDTQGAGSSGALVEDPHAPLTFYGVNNRSGNSGNGKGVIFKMVVTPLSAPPVITSATTANGQKGVPFSYQITATNSPTSYGATLLPAGLSVDPATGIISGTPTFAGTTPIGISATNNGGTGTGTLTLTVAAAGAAPVITSAATTTATVGTAFTYQITASNTPTSYTASGLPDSLSLDPSSGIISGTPTAVGTFSVALGASNAVGTGTGTLAITVAPASASGQPTVMITSPPNSITLVAGSNLPLAASISDPTQVSAVQFSINGIPVGMTAVTGPYVANVNAPSVPGTYTLAIVVTDLQNRQSTGSITVNVIAADPANPPPVTDLLTPLDGRNLLAGSTLLLTASASSSGPGVDHVSFYADGVLLMYAANPPGAMNAPRQGVPTRQDANTPDPVGGSVFQIPYTVPAADKLVNLLVVAFDKLGQATVASVQTIHATVTSDKAPLVALSGVSNMTPVSVGSTTKVTVTASDPDAVSLAQSGARPVRLDASGTPGVAKLENFINKALISLLTAPPYDFSFSPPSAGVYVLHSVATNNDGIAAISDPVVVEADAATPTVTIAAAGDDMAVEGGENGKVVVRRTGDTSAALVVRYKVKGAAKAGVDYKALSGTATIPAGAAQVKIKIKPVNNQTVDGTRVAKVKLLPSTDGSYNLGTATAAKVKIIDND